MASVFSALEGNAGRIAEARLLSYSARNPRFNLKSGKRNHRYFCPGLCCWRDFFEARSRDGPCRWPWAIPCGEPCVGHWPVSRRPHWIRHQPRTRPRTTRSEEHTSELQSLAYLVCRLLLEKKKKDTENIPQST